MNLNKTYFELNNQHVRIISSDLYYPSNLSKKNPLIFICHGFKGFKDWGFFPYVSETLALNGFITICFDFSLNGKPDKNLFVTNIHDFANNTVSHELDDLNDLITAIQNNSIDEFKPLKEFWNGEIYLLGHSLGAAISILTALNNPKITKIALWAPIAKFDRYTKRQKDVWKQNGFLEYTNQKTNQLLRMNISYLLDVENNKEKFNLPSAIANLIIPILIVHGKQDVTVPLAEVQMLIEANQEIRAKIIEKTAHTFGVEHPFSETNPALEEAINSTIDFFRL